MTPTTEIHHGPKSPGGQPVARIAVGAEHGGQPVGASGAKNSRIETGSTCWLGTRFSLPEMLEPIEKSRLFRECPKILSLARLAVPSHPDVGVDRGEMVASGAATSHTPIPLTVP
jgi:hypothetical protein